MEHTFLTIQDLTSEANVLFASESIIDILGYSPEEVLGKSCFDYFHPDEVPLARSIHSRGVLLDKAAVLHYARIRSRDGTWVSCELCFTVVHDVLFACTSIYRRGVKSERRAIEAPQIRRIFSCSPRDPRYHMLEHLSPKFKMPPTEREPRAALVLNRFTRNLNVMFATSAVSSILGLSPDEIKHASFYDCIQQRCLAEAVRCLESAKANDSIAYLRFWYRDPRLPADEEMTDDDEDIRDDDDDESDEEDEVKVEIKDEWERRDSAGAGMDLDLEQSASATNAERRSSRPRRRPSAWSRARSFGAESVAGRNDEPRIELEAVVSCTSDGLVVVLRRARPPIPTPHPPLLPVDNGMFAAPWGQDATRPPHIEPEQAFGFRPTPHHLPRDSAKYAAGGQSTDNFMRSIRDVAVFAWALAGINGNIAGYGRGTPMGEAQPPPNGLPVWDPHATAQMTAPIAAAAAAAAAAAVTAAASAAGAGAGLPSQYPAAREAFRADGLLVGGEHNEPCGHCTCGQSTGMWPDSRRCSLQAAESERHLHHHQCCRTPYTSLQHGHLDPLRSRQRQPFHSPDGLHRPGPAAPQDQSDDAAARQASGWPAHSACNFRPMWK